MGFLGLFGKGGAGALKKHAARAGNKRAQAPDRWESIQTLGAMKTAEAVEALLVRFTFSVDPSITDQEEKDLAYRLVIDAGEAAVGPVRDFLRRSDSIAWPLKCLEPLVGAEELTTELLALVDKMDTEYERDPQKKIDVIGELEERRDPRILPAVQRFLEDANETVRFHAVATIFAQEGAEAAREALLATYLREDSVRVRVRILDGFIARGWDVASHVDAVRPKLPAGYAIDAKGKLTKK